MSLTSNGVFIRHKLNRSSVAVGTVERAFSPSRAGSVPGNSLLTQWSYEEIQEQLVNIDARLSRGTGDTLLKRLLLSDETSHSGCLNGWQPGFLFLAIGRC